MPEMYTITAKISCIFLKKNREPGNQNADDKYGYERQRLNDKEISKSGAQSQ